MIEINDDDDNEEQNYEENIESILDGIPLKLNECFLCTNFFECSRLKFNNEALDTSTWIVPELNVLDEINATMLDMFAKQLSSSSTEKLHVAETDSKHQIHESQRSKKVLHDHNNSFSYKAPESFGRVIKNHSKSLFDDFDFTQIELKIEQEKKRTSSVSKEKMETKDVINNKNENIELQFKDTLTFFKLSSLEDLFLHCDHDKNQHVNKNKVSDAVESQNLSCISNETILYSPDKCYDSINEKSPIINRTICINTSSDEGSPILCSYERVKYLKDKAQRNLFNSTKDSQKQNNEFDTTSLNNGEPVRVLNKQFVKKPKLSNLFSRTDSNFYPSKNVQNQSTSSNGTEKKLFGKLSIPISKENASTIPILTDSVCNVTNETLSTSCDAKNKVAEKNCADIISNIEDIFDISVLESSCRLSRPNENNTDVHLKNKKTDFSEKGCVLNKSIDLLEQSTVSKSKTRLKNNKSECTSKVNEDDLISNIEDIFDVSVLKSSWKLPKLNDNDCDVHSKSKKTSFSQKGCTLNKFTELRKQSTVLESETQHENNKSECPIKVNENDLILNIQDVFDVSILEPSHRLSRLNENKNTARLNYKKTVFSQKDCTLNKLNDLPEQSLISKSKPQHKKNKSECPTKVSDDLISNIEDIFDVSILESSYRLSRLQETSAQLKSKKSTSLQKNCLLDKYSDFAEHSTVLKPKTQNKKNEVVCPPKVAENDLISNIEDIFDVSILESSYRLSRLNDTSTSLQNKKTAFSQKDSTLNNAIDLIEHTTAPKSKSQNEKSEVKCSPKAADNYLQSLLNVDDICDLSIFGFGKEKVLNKINANETSVKDNSDLPLCDLDAARKNSSSEISFELNRDISNNDAFHNSSFIKPRALKLSSLSTKKKLNSIVSNQKRKDENDITLELQDIDISNRSENNQSLLSVTQILDIVDMKNKAENSTNPPPCDGYRHRVENSSSSENEFDTGQVKHGVNKSGISISRKRAARKSTRNVVFDSDDDFEMPINQSKNLKTVNKPKEECSKAKTRKKTRVPKSNDRANPFIEVEAEVSEDECLIISEDERDSEDDSVFDASFVNDETQMFAHNTQMHAHYLQTVR